ncbi:MAG: class II aldolase/adducin family protein [Pseudomonadota bacterium]|nr:class II aldolase/adducin family protein [Pseudomonadota bacterium]
MRRDAGAALGDGYALLVRGRGLLVCGNTLTQTWKLLFFLDKCCRSQIAAMAAAHAAGTPLTVPSDAVVTHAVAQSRGFVEHPRYIAD